MDESTRAWLDERFGRLTDLLKAACDDGKRRDEKLDDHEARLVKLERMSWLLAMIGALLVPVALDALRGLLGL